MFENNVLRFDVQKKFINKFLTQVDKIKYVFCFNPQHISLFVEFVHINNDEKFLHSFPNSGEMI